MPSYWPVWVIGAVLLLVAGFATAFVPRWRRRSADRRAAWARARAAIESATISRDAVPAAVAAADQLLSRAETIAAHRGGRSAARAATRYARQADELWRAAADA
ncbi:DUF6403 family protein [Luedemannella helvata]|uniref:Uncharacterized protein n=1 Tax=Luedemannella helvata TaxID=349315 RepID=A0ABP4X5S2_9ACTN